MKFSADWFSHNVKDVSLKCPKLGIDAFGSVFNNQFVEILFTNQIGIMKK